MINPTLNINKSFREQVNKCIKTTFVTITQPHIKTTLAKKKTRVVASVMFYWTWKNPEKAFKVLSCIIYTMIINYVCIGYLSCEYFKKVYYLLVLEGGLNTETFMTKYCKLEFHICPWTWFLVMDFWRKQSCCYIKMF